MPSPASDSRTFQVKRLIADSQEFFGLPSYVAAGALNSHAPSDVLSVQAAYAEVIQWAGAAAASRSAIVATDPDTFEVVQVFDLGRCATFYGAATILSVDVDGEVFGRDPGELVLQSSWEVSRNGSTWSSVGSTWALRYNAAAAGEATDYFGVTPRFVRITLKIVLGDNDPNSGALYAGSNHPAVQAQIAFEYV